MSKPFSRAIYVLSMSGILASYGLVQSETTSKNDYKLINKKIVATFLGALMKHYDSSMEQLANAYYIKHNPFAPAGLNHLVGLIPGLKALGTPCYCSIDVVG